MWVTQNPMNNKVNKWLHLIGGNKNKFYNWYRQEFLQTFSMWVVFTSKWVNFWMSREGMTQSLVIIQHAKSLKISIFENFDSIYKRWMDYLTKKKEKAKINLCNDLKHLWCYLVCKNLCYTGIITNISTYQKLTFQIKSFISFRKLTEVEIVLTRFISFMKC